MANERPDYAYQLFILTISIYALVALTLDVLVKPEPEIRELIPVFRLRGLLSFLIRFCEESETRAESLAIFFARGVGLICFQASRWLTLCGLAVLHGF